MDYFVYKGNTLYCEDVPVAEIAKQAGTPVYIYSLKTATEHVKRIQEAFAELDPLICYSLKANSNHLLVTELLKLGVGCDVVSGGELFRALKAGCDPRKIAFAGVGKTDAEIKYALQSGILMFNVESAAELENINRIAGEMGVTARAAIRINPDVDPETHRYITTGKRENKFGIDFKVTAGLIADWHFDAVKFVGFHLHIGSQITKTAPYAQAVEKTLALVEQARRHHPVEYLNLGGGFGINYAGNEALNMAEFGEAIVPLLRGAGLKILFEPGRFIMGNAGILVTRVLYLKTSGDKRFVLCDAGMTDLVRPTLYQAYHRIWPVTCEVEFDSIGKGHEQDPRLVTADVVGPICESGDFFAQDRRLPGVDRGDLLSVFSAGAYGMTMSSNYNSHPRPPEVLVQGDRWRVVRTRETYDDLMKHEVT